jgi:hypothetical protein
MNEHLEEAALMTRPTAEIGRLGSRSMVLGGIGLALTAVGFLTARDTFLQSYLIAFIFWMGITMGSLAVLMVQYLSGGAWGLVARRILEASTRTLPLMALLFLPIAFQLPVLYPWARPEAATDVAVQKKVAYLNPHAFELRAVLFFVILGVLVFIFNRWSKEQDESAPLLPGPQDRRFRVLAGPGLVCYVLIVTLMSVDWVMSLDPHWYSAIFGILMLGGQGLATMAFTVLVLTKLMRVKPMSEVATTENLHDLSKLMFAFTMLWAYFSVSQLLIIWSANLPEEIPYYLKRFSGPWGPVSVAVLVGQFVVPFLLLLSRSLKRTPSIVGHVAFFILIMRIVDIALTIGPMVRPEGAGLHWLDFAAVAGMGALWLAFFWRNLASRSLLPARDPYFKEAFAHGGH